MPTHLSASFPKVSRWVVYLILSSNPPAKTYVGVTNNFRRRLKQHNGELKGGAKASRAGRPWICACLIRGFLNRSTGQSLFSYIAVGYPMIFACKVESKWKSFSRKVTWKRRSQSEEQPDDAKLYLLQRRKAALNQVIDSMDFSDLEIHWHLDFAPL
ncbi:structure-specific endonuclease subunit slx1 [Dorcoceras hygrometricum]|uniref:Structure-specific endonuclease subunit slx1 n=1 Tax=Dorcoceras hygrometricum TaxID=472368 RepID=A0A2Z7BEV1_9LAMI|nr:structure-specific endonuclease subunit slx1 [Dorcoceras hygrometricum]